MKKLLLLTCILAWQLGYSQGGELSVTRGRTTSVEMQNITSPQLIPQPQQQMPQIAPTKPFSIGKGSGLVTEWLDFSGINDKPNVVVRRSQNPNMATITFRVVGKPLSTSDWMQLNGRPGDEAGFHILLDGSGELVNWARNVAFSDNPWWVNWEPLYTMSSHRIPANASPNLNAPNYLNDGEASIEIPPGIYDMAILIPYSRNRDRIFSALIKSNTEIWLHEALIQGFRFQAGYEYIFTANQRDIIFYDAQRDLNLRDVIIPLVSHNMTATEDVTIVIENAGSVAINDNIQVSYRINEGVWITETVNVSLPPGAQMTYTFNAKADFSALGYYTVEAKIDYALDQWPINDVFTARTKQVAPMNLPFFEGFPMGTGDDPSESVRWRGNWRIVDRNIVGAFHRGSETWAEHLSWRWSAFHGPDGTPGYVEVRAYTNEAFLGDTHSDDFLVSNPINIPVAGDYHISFFRQTWPATQSLRILYGTSSNIDEMQVLVDWPNITHLDFAWRRMFHNFTIVTPGVYYFAFHYYAPINIFGILAIDDIRIEQGLMAGDPDIRLMNVIVPQSACNMTNAQISVRVRNNGNTVIATFTGTYQIGDATPVTQTFNQTLAVGAEATVTFNQQLDVSIVGEYVVNVTVMTPNDVNPYNNHGQATIRHFSPITQLPFTCNFMNEADRNRWSGLGWQINTFAGIWVASPSGPLLSQCISLEPGIYRFAYTFLSGSHDGGDCHYVAVGLTGTDPSTWPRLREWNNHTVMPVFSTQDDEFEFMITEAGLYNIGFFQTCLFRSLGFTRTSLTLVRLLQDHDARIIDVDFPAPFTRITPAAHAQGQHTIDVAIENIGQHDVESGILEVIVNDNVSGSTTFNFTSIGQVVNVPLIADFSVLPSGSNTFEFHAFNNLGMNEVARVVKLISDSTFARDYIDGGFGDGLGSSTGTASFGTIFELTKSDTLTSITV
ncbi:MAG: DUF2436 domain-containing protein, partial [Bacteroidales bacterium]|nr:DUF2436 domain-containing protein [Bacteroidales bacterium]